MLKITEGYLSSLFDIHPLIKRHVLLLRSHITVVGTLTIDTFLQIDLSLLQNHL